ARYEGLRLAPVIDCGYIIAIENHSHLYFESGLGRARVRGHRTGTLWRPEEETLRVFNGLLVTGTAAVALGMSGCGGTSGSSTPAGQVGSSAPGGVRANPSALASLGEKIFHDESLSASGRMSCATCHDPDHAFVQPSASGVSLGGAGLDMPGVRNAPS